MDGAVSKGEFAALIGVSPGRVSQYLAEGKISAAALVGHGRSAKINVDRARADLRLTLDISQRLGNGIDTRLDDDEDAVPVFDRGRGPELPFAQPTSSGGQPKAPSTDQLIKQEKLDQLRRANRNAAIADAQTAGQLVEVPLSRAEMARLAGSMLLTFEGSLASFADAIASEFKVPQRDVLHILRGEFRKVRATAAATAHAEAVELPETIETFVEAEDIETIN